MSLENIKSAPITMSDLYSYTDSAHAMYVKGKWYPIVIVNTCECFQMGVIAGNYIRISRTGGYTFDIMKMYNKIASMAKKDKDKFKHVKKIDTYPRKNVHIHLNLLPSSLTLIE